MSTTVHITDTQVGGKMVPITVGPSLLKTGNISLCLSQDGIALGYGKVLTLSTGKRAVAIRTKPEIVRALGANPVLHIEITPEQESAIDMAIADYTAWLMEAK